MSSIPAAKERTQQFGAEVEAILKAWFPDQDRKTAVVCIMNLFGRELSRLREENERLERQVKGYQHHLRACEQIAGKALGYPWFKDDQKNFPDATEADGVCIGDHVGDTIVEELATRFETVTRERDEALERNLKASKWLCRYELAMLADDLDMKIQWDEEGPCSLAEDISPGFDPVAYQLEFEAERRARQSKEGGE